MGEHKIKLDLKAGRQRFTYDKKFLTANIPPNTENPIDIALRLKAMSLNPQFNFFTDFHNKWVVVKTPKGLRIGRIKDMYLASCDIRLRTRQGAEIIASFENCLTLSEREP